MESNKKYSVTERLSSLDVDKALLKNIEDYFSKNISNLIDIPKSRIKEGYTIKIVDVDNELTLDSIDSYEHDLFPDGITEIRIRFQSYNREKGINVDFQVKFVKVRFFSKVELEITSSNPKEVAVGVLAKLKEIFEKKRNHNWLFQPRLKLYPILIALLIGVEYLSKFVFKNNNKWEVAAILFDILLVSYIYLFDKWKPYISFDTRLQRTYDKWAGIFLWGIPPFIVFGVALPKIIDFLFSK